MTTTWQAQPHTDAEPEDIKHHLPLHSQDFSLSLSGNWAEDKSLWGWR